MARRDLEHAGAPSAEELLAYRDGVLDGEERTRLEVRIAAFPDAARALEDLAAFPDVVPAPGVEPPSEEEIDRGWRSFRNELAALAAKEAEDDELGDGAGYGAVLPPPAAALSPKATSPEPQATNPAWLRLAAALALLAIGATAGWWLRGGGDDLSINTVVVELEPVGSLHERSFQPLGALEEGAWQATEPVEIPRDSRRVVLVLAQLDAGQYADYSLRMETDRGETLWSRRGLRRQGDGTFRVDLPGVDLPPGRYRLLLSGQASSGSQLVATYLLAVAGE